MMLWHWNKRRLCSDIVNLSNLIWLNVTPSHDLPRSRRSAQLGHGCCIGLAETSTNSLYQATDSISDTDSLPGEEFSANNT